ncbi:MAG TPA: YSC84-related protein [Verrucomicrobiae bacterium]|jgi:lipid-binding SYLF domain-containing protein|nr:YSC84-related protein [Verrucomicrobiae bacterium]
MNAMKKIAVLTATSLLLTLAGFASERRDADLERIQTASTVLNQIMSAPDRAIPDSIMSGAKCIAIIPSSLKASFIFGANYGKGVATCRTDKGWSSPAFFKVTGGSFGFQAGGQASDLVLIIRTDDGMQHLLQSKFKLGADASAAAGPVGRDAQASTDLTMRAQVLTYSRARGLFLGVSLSGGVINQDQADTQAFYGKDWTYFSVLNGEVPPPKEAMVLLNTVEKYAPTPKRPPAPVASAMPSEPAGRATTAAPLTASNTPAAVAPTAETAEPAAEPSEPAATSTPAAVPAPNTTPVAAPAATSAPSSTGAGENR